MKLLIINPNTSEAMTEDIRRTILMVKNKEIDIEVIHSDFGAESLESFYDYTIASFGMIRCLKKHAKDYDGILIACFGDPGLYAIKEIYDCPVVGIAEASISIANLLGTKFSILAASEKAGPMMDYLVAGYGMQDRSAGAIAINMSVLDVERNKEEAIGKLVDAGRIAKERGAEVFILGCAGMTGVSETVEKKLGIRVLDPVLIGYSVLEMMVNKNISIGKSGLFSTPVPKTFLKENLLWRKQEAKDEELWKALEIAQGKDFVEEKGEGLDLPVSIEGKNFSGGQRQRLSIARALVGDSKLLILDDSSSALDMLTERKLRTALEGYQGEKSLLVISQRVSSIRHFPKILVLDQGKLIGLGSHQELMENCSVYQEICASQKQGKEA